MKTISIILADDHKLIRDGIKTLLKKNNQFDVIGEAGNGEELIKKIDTLLPDLILIDITMPKLNGLDAIAELKKINANLKFIVLTMHEEGDYVMKAIHAGAQGYLLKNCEFEELEKAIITVYEGGKYYNSVISNLMIENLANQKKNEEEIPELTNRELEVLKLVAEGLSTKLIADKLFISPRTVETHRVNMMKKFEVHNTVELLRKCVQAKIIS
jgi:DNA-binding NarL/FixJ family response regulator